MTLRRAFALTGLLALGCAGFREPIPELDPPAVWNEHGVAFEYPANWGTSSETEDEITTVYVESAGSALVMVQIFEPGLTIDPDQAIELAVAGMKEVSAELSGGMLDLSEVEVSPFTRPIAGAERTARRAAFALSVGSIDVPHTMELHFVEEPAGLTLIYTQSTNEDRDRAQPGFDRVLDSFRRLEPAPATSR